MPAPLTLCLSPRRGSWQWSEAGPSTWVSAPLPGLGAGRAGRDLEETLVSLGSGASIATRASESGLEAGVQRLVPKRDQPVPPLGMGPLSRLVLQLAPSPACAYFQGWGARAL